MLVLKIAGGCVLAYIGIKGAGIAIDWIKYYTDDKLRPPRRPR